MQKCGAAGAYGYKGSLGWITLYQYIILKGVYTTCLSKKERREALQRVIDELRDEPGALMPIMQRAQDIFGYLPEEVQQYIAKEMDIPVSDVYGVATFYAQFNLEPKGQYTISVCMGYGVLRQGQPKGAGQAGGSAGHNGGTYHAGRRIYAERHPLPRRVRIGTGYDD